MTWSRFFAGLGAVALWSLRGIWGALLWLLKELGAIVKARAQGVVRGFMNLLFGSWKRIGVTLLVLLLVLSSRDPQMLEHVLPYLLMLGVMVGGFRLILSPLFPKKKKKARGT